MKKNLNEQQEFANDLIDFISYSPSAFHVTRNIKAALLRKGFKELSLTEDWKIEKEGKYFVSQNDTALVTFIVGMGSPETDGFRIIAAHTDSPCIKVKPNPEISSYGYLKLNTEIYGSTILSMVRPSAIDSWKGRTQNQRPVPPRNPPVQRQTPDSYNSQPRHTFQPQCQRRQTN